MRQNFHLGFFALPSFAFAIFPFPSTFAPSDVEIDIVDAVTSA